MAIAASATKKKGRSKAGPGLWKRLRVDYAKHKWIYWMMVPVMIYYIVFLYFPMAGQVIAFQDYRPAKGILGSDWVWLENFIDFFKSPFAFRTIRNTIMISLFVILVGFPGAHHPGAAAQRGALQTL